MRRSENMADVNKKNIQKVMIIVVVICLAAAAVWTFIFRTRKISLPFQAADEIQKVSIMSGNTGDTIKVQDEKDWEKIVNSLSGLRVRKVMKNDRSGWGYQLSIKTASADFSITVAGERCSLNQSTYQIVEDKGDTEKLLGEIFDRLKE